MEGVEFTEIPGILEWMKQQGKGFQPVKDIARHFMSQPIGFEDSVSRHVNFASNLSALARSGAIRRCYKVMIDGKLSEKEYERGATNNPRARNEASLHGRP